MALNYRTFLKQYGMYFLPSIFLIHLVLDAYQIDFRAFYIAGKATLFHLDPYLNHVTQYPEFYVPLNGEATPRSGFLYPPPAAFFFLPLGFFDYTTAKVLFGLVVLGALTYFCFLFHRRDRSSLPGEVFLLLMVSFPIFAHFERGQVDVVVLALAYGAFFALGPLEMAKPKRGWQISLAALPLALAICLKIFPVITLGYFLYRRQYGFVGWAIAWTGLIFCLPLLYFEPTVYRHFFQTLLPQVFGPVPSFGAIDLHGQGVVNNLVFSEDSAYPLLASHNFPHGYMNPFLKDHTLGAIAVGTGFLLLLLGLNHRNAPDFSFHSTLTLINLFNPKPWIMGLVWFFPAFLYLYPRTTALGRTLILLPLFLPPSLNASGMLSVLLMVVFAWGFREPRWGRSLIKFPAPGTPAPALPEPEG